MGPTGRRAPSSRQRQATRGLDRPGEHRDGRDRVDASVDQEQQTTGPADATPEPRPRHPSIGDTDGDRGAQELAAATSPRTIPDATGASVDKSTAHWPTFARSQRPPNAQYRLNPACTRPASPAVNTSARLAVSLMPGVTSPRIDPLDIVSIPRDKPPPAPVDRRTPSNPGASLEGIGHRTQGVRIAAGADVRTRLSARAEPVLWPGGCAARGVRA